MRTIVGIQVKHRGEEAREVQELLTKYGCIIKTRLGMHDAGSLCSDEGLILLDVIDSKEQVSVEYFMEELGRLDDIKVKRMDF